MYIPNLQQNEVAMVTLFVIHDINRTYVRKVSLSAAVSLGPAYIHINPGPPLHLRPISINTMLPRQPVRLILSLSQVIMGEVGSAGLMMSSCPGWFSDFLLLREIM